MSDNLRRYRAIKSKLLQLTPKELTGRAVQHLNVLALFISGIVGSGSTHLRQVAQKAPPGAKVESRIKQLSRWYQNEQNNYEMHYLPFIEPLLAHLAELSLVLSIDGSAIGRGCMTLMVSLIYQKRAIPLIWLVLDRPKGHLAAEAHIALLEQLRGLLPAGADVILLGDGEFDSVALQRYLTQQGWSYVCRTAQDSWVLSEGEWVQLNDLALPGRRLGLVDVAFSQQAYGPVTVVVWWEKGHQHPLFLVSNLTLVAEICHWYRRRMTIETFFSDQKSRGFHLDKSHIADPDRLFRLLLPACLAYIWMIYLGVQAVQQGYVPLLHRTDRCDLSLFQLGLALLDYWLNAELPILVDFRLPSDFMFAKSVR